MKLLLDCAPTKYHRLREQFDFIGGQLLTPLTRYSYQGGVYAVDNGAFSKFSAEAFRAILERDKRHRDNCLFVVCPDVVGNARRTLDAFDHWADELTLWPLALAIQDGVEDLPIPWPRMSAIFVGGSTEFKLSKAAADVIRCAQLLEKHTHVGRINTVERWHAFESIGVDTCDGSGVSRFDWMLEAIAAARRNGGHMPLFAGSDRSEGGAMGDDGCEIPNPVPCVAAEPGAAATDDRLGGNVETGVRTASGTDCDDRELFSSHPARDPVEVTP